MATDRDRDAPSSNDANDGALVDVYTANNGDIFALVLYYPDGRTGVNYTAERVDHSGAIRYRLTRRGSFDVQRPERGPGASPPLREPAGGLPDPDGGAGRGEGLGRGGGEPGQPGEAGRRAVPEDVNPHTHYRTWGGADVTHTHARAPIAHAHADGDPQGVPGTFLGPSVPFGYVHPIDPD